MKEKKPPDSCSERENPLGIETHGKANDSVEIAVVAANVKTH